MEEIKKGPWKAEEDQVLINHVNRYGTRDWSSIRSKGLLQRTGKSCRLRWVNKLRPNLKTGCKFEEEEERIVIELQSEFGNKWAAIATYLPGRTDNDVKNFWSSRQKRLARRTKGKSEKRSSASSKVDETLPDLSIKLEHQPFTFGTDLGLAETETTSMFAKSHTANQIPFSPETEELLSRFNDPFYNERLGPTDSSEPFFDQSPMPRRCSHGSKDKEPDFSLDDFPADMFDQVDPTRSP